MSSSLFRLKAFLYEAELPGARPPLRDGEGRIISGYRLIREVGRGGMAEVFEAEETASKRRVALKLVKPACGDAAHAARLRREASIAAQLHHPNIIRVFEVGEAPDLAGQPVSFIAMEFVEGRTFADAMISPAVAQAELLRILEDAARAAGFAHQQGVVHRDVKPANILVSDEGRAVLTDFGLARMDLFATRLTGSDMIMGTPQYMAPEQIEGTNDLIGPWTDVYALGTILYEVLAGRLPFQAVAPVDLYRQVLHHEPPRPLSRPNFPQLESVCLRALEKDVRDRYEDAAAFADDLGRARRGESIESPRGGLFRRLRRRFTRACASWEGAIEATIAGVALGVVALHGPRPFAAALAALAALGLALSHRWDRASEATREEDRAHLDAGKALLRQLEELLKNPAWDPFEIENLAARACRELAIAARDPKCAGEALAAASRTWLAQIARWRAYDSVEISECEDPPSALTRPA